jgi:hypothetical protein
LEADNPTLEVPGPLPLPSLELESALQDEPAQVAEELSLPTPSETTKVKPAPRNKKEAKPAAQSKQEAKPVAKGKQEAKPTAKGKQEAKPAAPSKPEAKPAAKGKQEAKPVAKGKQEAKSPILEAKSSPSLDRQESQSSPTEALSHEETSLQNLEKLSLLWGDGTLTLEDGGLPGFGLNGMGSSEAGMKSDQTSPLTQMPFIYGERTRRNLGKLYEFWRNGTLSLDMRKKSCRWNPGGQLTKKQQDQADLLDSLWKDKILTLE